MKDKIIMEKLLEKDDIFSWSELNCFNRVFAIALNYISEDYYDTFLLFISAYVSFVINGERMLSFDGNDCTLTYFNEELGDVFGGKICKNVFSSKRDMNKKISEKLSDKFPVVLPSDLFGLKYCKTYLEQHRRHYMIIKGIDEAKNIYYILDNMHNNLGADTRYSDFMIDIDNAYNMCASFCKNFDILSNKNYFWSIEANENQNFTIDSNNYLIKIFAKIISMEEKNWFENKLINGEKTSDNINHYMEYVNNKKLFYRLLQRFIMKKYTKEASKELADKVDSFIAKLENFKIQFALNYYKNGNINDDLKEQLLRSIKAEKDILKYATKVLEENELVKPEIVSKSNIYTLQTDDSKTYDIWNNICEGKIKYLKTGEDKSGLSINMKMETEFGGTTHAGIIIEFENEEKLLFGSLGKMNTGIHRISNSPEYELFMQREPFDESIDYEIRFKNDEIHFYSNGKFVFKYENKNQLKQYGIFLKSWENCECRAEINIYF